MAPGAKIEGSNVEIEGEKCGLDMSSYEDLPLPTVGGDCNGSDGKDDYVFVNGSDAGSDDHRDPVGNGELDATLLDLHSHAMVNGNAQFEAHTGDVVLDDPGQQDRSDQVDFSGSSDDSSQKVEGGGAADISLRDQSEVANGHVHKPLEVGDGINGEIRNEGKVEGGELVKDNVEVNPKGDLVFEDTQLAAENAGTNNIEIDVDVKVKDLDVLEGNHTKLAQDVESCIEKGGICNSSVDDSTTLVLDSGDDDDKVRIPLGTDKGSDAVSPDEDGVQNGISVVDATPLVSDGDSEQQHHVETQRDEEQGDNLDSQIVTCESPVVEDNVEPHVDEVTNRESESLDNTAENLKPSEGDVECQTLEDGVSETQPLDGAVKDSHLSASSEHHPLDAESKEPPENDGVTENQSSDCQQPELQCADERNEVVRDEAGAQVKERGESDSSVAVKQELDFMDSEVVRCLVIRPEECGTKDQNTKDMNSESHEIQELQRDPVQSEGAEHQSNELRLNDAEIEFTEGGDLDLPNTTVSQEFNSLDSEAARCELNHSEEHEIIAQNATELTVDSEEMKEPQTDSMQSEEAENRIVIESAAPSVEGPVSDGTTHGDISEADLTTEVEESCGTSPGDIHCITAEKPQVDCETEKVDAKVKSDMIAEVVGNQESPVGDDILLDQGAEETRSVNVTDKEISLEHIDLEKTAAVEEATNLSEIEAGTDAAMDEDRSNLDAVGVSENKISEDLVNDIRTVPASGETSNDGEGSLISEGDDFSKPVDSAADYPGSSDVDTIKEQVVDNAAATADKNTSADDTCPQPKVESGNGSLPGHVHDNDLDITGTNGETDVASNSSCISSDSLKPKISFGSFVCEAPFSGNDVSIPPEVSNRSSKVTSGLSKVTGENSESKIKHSNGVAILNVEANGVHFIGLNHDKTCHDVPSVEHGNTDEVSSLPPAGSGSGAPKGQNTELGRRPFYYLIRVPRYDDEKLKEQIRLSELEVEEKTQSRDAVRLEYQNRKGAIIQLKSDLEAARSEERAARELVKAKKREIDSSLALVNLARNALTVEDVQAQILSMEHKIQHETLHLKEEKQLVREIKQMKNLKDQLNANAPKQEELKQALEQKVQVEEHLKVLRKELASLRDNLSKAEEGVKVVRKKYDEESASLNELFLQFKSADTVRQDAYAHLLDLRKQWSEKNKHFWSYKDDARAANDFVVAGDKHSLDRHCVNQVEKFIELWNKNDEFRKEYIKCNTRSTLRRLRTLDGRALGPDEEPPSLGNVSDGRVTVSTRVSSVPAVSTIERDMSKVAKNVEDNSSKKVTEQKNKTVLAKKMPEATSKNSLAEASGRIEVEEEKEESKPTKEEEELARKAEQLRKEEEAARLREQRREEEKAKAQEALERKRRMAEKAQARAEFRARKEAELKEKEREKRAKKKEKKKGHTSEAAESEPAVQLESPPEKTREPEVTEKPVTVAKKPQKPSLYAKQIKTTKSIPPPLRNRGKRRMQQWMWALATVVAVLALFFLGNINFLRNNGLLGFGPAY